MSRKQKYEAIDRKKQIVYAVWVNDGELSYAYIGSGFYERLSGNCSKLRRNVHDNKQLQAAYNKVGEYKIEVLDWSIDDVEQARDIEDERIKYFKKLDDVIVCNKYPAVANKKYERKLTEEDVNFIRKLINKGKKNKDIAELFNVNPSTISRVKTGKRWASVHIEDKNKVESIGVDATSNTVFGDTVNL